MDLSLRGDSSEDDGQDHVSRGRRDDSRARDEDQDKRKRSDDGERCGPRSASKTGGVSDSNRRDERKDEDDDEDDYAHEEGRFGRAGMKRKSREDTWTGTSETGGGKRQDVGAAKKRTKFEVSTLQIFRSSRCLG